MRRAPRLVGSLVVVAAVAGSLGGRAALPLAALGLAGCPATPGDTAAAGTPSTAALPSAAPAFVPSTADLPDLTGVERGQRWVYELDGGALELVLAVRELGPGQVDFSESTIRTVPGLPQEAVGHYRLQLWEWWPTRAGERPYAGLPTEAHAVATRAGPQELTGVWFVQGGDKVLTRVVDGRPVFPGELRVERGGRVVRRLVRIE